MSNIFVVDDERTNRLLLKKILLKDNPSHVFIELEDGGQVFESIKTELPDIILLDIMMPHTDGFEVCLKLKQDKKTKNIPILMITALGDINDKLKAFDAGASDYIVKPIEPKETLARVNCHLQLKKYQDTIRQKQAELIEASKMATAGRLSAGVAHEFNNILGMMRGYVQTYGESSDLAKIKEGNQSLIELVNRGEKIIKDLLDFSKKEENQKLEKTNLAELIESNLVLMKKQFEKAGVKVEENLGSGVSVPCFPGQLSQVIINLCQNAIDAMANSDEKKFSVGFGPQVDPEIVEKLYNKYHISSPKDYALLFFRDTGEGISEDAKEHIFEPFFTTKGVLEGGGDNRPGVGLGLSVSYSIVNRHNGVLHFESEKNKGTTFFLLLPINSP